MTENVYVGVDVSKAKLNLCVENATETAIANTPAEIRKTLRKLAAKHGNIHVCLESTGVYGRALLDACHQLQTRVSLLNAKQTNLWARACGTLAKTDTLDARMLCRYARAQQPKPTPPATPWKARLQELRDMREVWMGEKIRLAGRLEQAFSTRLAQMLRTEIARLEKKTAALDAEMARLFAANEPVLLTRLTGVRGVGPLTACLVMAALPELGTLGAPVVAALGGVAPRTCESGTFKGRARTGGGRGHLRKVLYMPAVCAIRHNAILRAFYLRKRAEGKPGKVALTGVMRKLLVLLERIAADPDFTPAA